MFRSLEGNQRIVQALRLPIGLAGAPVSIVTGESENDVVVTEVLRALIVISPARARSANQREADGVVVRLIGCVLAIGENRRAIAATLISEIDPLVRSDFELARLFVWTLNRTHVPVVSRHLVRGAERERGLQIYLFCVPVDFVGEFDAIAGIPCSESNCLNEVGAFGLALDLQCNAGRTIFDYSHFR